MRVCIPARSTFRKARRSYERSMTGKKKCRLALQKEMGLSEQKDNPVFCVVSRFAAQKGLHLVVEGLNAIVERGGQIVVMGNGEHWLEEAFTRLDRKSVV